MPQQTVTPGEIDADGFMRVHKNIRVDNRTKGAARVIVRVDKRGTMTITIESADGKSLADGG